MAGEGQGWSIGVDFGTAFSKAAAMYADRSNGRVTREMTPLHIGAAARAQRSLIVPSAMFLNAERVHFGPRAVEEYRRLGDDRREMLQSFKTILGAADFEHALDLLPSRSVDPDGEFRRGDLIVLYLAYLLELIERAAPEELGDLFTKNSKVRMRYSRPGWVPRRAEAAGAAMERMIQAAAVVRLEIGDALLASDGLPYDAAMLAVRRAYFGGEAFPHLDGGVFEASAVAACHLIDPSTPDHVVVVDIGAGTSDFAGFVRDGEVIDTIERASRTISVAGDMFDRALINLLMSKAKFLHTTREQSMLWRNLLSQIRDLKEVLVKTGRVEVNFRNESLKCKLSEFASDPGYKDSSKAIAEVYQRTLKDLVADFRGSRPKRIGLILAGGGSHLPSTIHMARKFKSVDGIKIELVPTSPRWASDLNSNTEFEALFAQMSVAFGAAIAEPNQFASKFARDIHA